MKHLLPLLLLIACETKKPAHHNKPYNLDSAIKADPARWMIRLEDGRWAVPDSSDFLHYTALVDPGGLTIGTSNEGISFTYFNGSPLATVTAFGKTFNHKTEPCQVYYNRSLVATRDSAGVWHTTDPVHAFEVLYQINLQLVNENWGNKRDSLFINN